MIFFFLFVWRGGGVWGKFPIEEVEETTVDGAIGAARGSGEGGKRGNGERTFHKRVGLVVLTSKVVASQLGWVRDLESDTG